MFSTTENICISSILHLFEFSIHELKYQTESGKFVARYENSEDSKCKHTNCHYLQFALILLCNN
jgi:hypothetical protein